MGNCVSFQFQVSCDDVITRCLECVSGQILYICKLKSNLVKLETAAGELRASKNDVNRRLGIEEGPLMKRRERVEVWLSRVETRLTEADELIQEGQQEVDKLCIGGCCSRSCKSSYVLGKRVLNKLHDVDELKGSGEFDKLVERVPAEAEYLRSVEGKVQELRATNQELRALKERVMQRVKIEERQQKKRLKSVQDWLSSVEVLISEVDALIRNCPQHIEKLRGGRPSDFNLEEEVSKKLIDVVALRESGDFHEVAEIDLDYISKVEDNLEELRRAKEELRGLKNDVVQRVAIEERQQKTRLAQVQEWLSSVEAAMNEVDALLREGPQEIEALRRGGSCSFRFGEKVAKKLESVIALTGKGDFRVVAEKALAHAVAERPTEPTVGLETMFDKVWSCLMEDNTGSIGLYGMGGVGKTSLLNQIHNKFVKTRGDFDYVIWIVVSKELRLVKVQEEIGKKIGIPVEEWKNKSFDERAEDIFNVLRKKKFVLLLDDVWERVDLSKVGIPLPRRQNGSKVVFTTRSVVVCSQMDAHKWIKVEPLEWDNAWELFQKKVKKEALNADPAILPIAQAVARECAGLPLALITIARAMAYKRTPEEWSYALEVLRISASNLQGMGDEVFPLLKFSYDSLPDKRVRSCFLYCALFPEDYKILKDDLINYWICEKFWEGYDNEVSAYKEGHNIIGTLIYACLLEEEGKYVKMHDVLRDMALWIACKFERMEENCFVRAGAQLIKAPDAAKWEVLRRMSLMENSIEDLREPPNCPYLWTLLLCRNSHLRKINDNFFQHMPALTVLDLSSSGMKKLPLGISSLESLHYLNLAHTGIELLPRDLQGLKKLKYLNLEHNTFLGMIPRGLISSFKGLQVLKMFHCGFFYENVEDNVLSDSDALVEELEQLEHLEILSIAIRRVSALKRLSKSNQLLGCVQTLSLECFNGSKLLDASSLAKMNHMQTLQISASADLEELKFDFAMDAEKQDPVGIHNSAVPSTRCFDSLREVTVEYCSHLRDLRWLALAQNLTFLKVAVCERMEEIVNGEELECFSDGSEIPSLFGRLEELVLEELPVLKCISQSSLPFPRLKRIRVLDCPVIKMAPITPDNDPGAKLIIEAEENWWKAVGWDDSVTKVDFRTCPPRKRIYRPSYLFDSWKL